MRIKCVIVRIKTHRSYIKKGIKDELKSGYKFSVCLIRSFNPLSKQSRPLIRQLPDLGMLCLQKH